MKNWLCLVLWISYTASAQEKFTISGYIRDSATGETIIGATVQVTDKAETVTSNQYGYYSLTLNKGEHALTVSHVSYQTVPFSTKLQVNLQHDFLLLPKSAAMNEVLVYSRRRDHNVKTAQLGRIDLSVNQIKNIPAL